MNITNFEMAEILAELMSAVYKTCEIFKISIAEFAATLIKNSVNIQELNKMTTIIDDPGTHKKIADKIIANRKKRDEQMTEEQRNLRFLSEKAMDFINLVRERAPKNEDGTMRGFSFAIPLDEPTENSKCRMLMLKVYECDEDLHGGE